MISKLPNNIVYISLVELRIFCNCNCVRIEIFLEKDVELGLRILLGNLVKSVA